MRMTLLVSNVGTAGAGEQDISSINIVISRTTVIAEGRAVVQLRKAQRKIIGDYAGYKALSHPAYGTCSSSAAFLFDASPLLSYLAVV